MPAEPQNGMPSRKQLKYDMVKIDGRLKEVIHLEKLTRKQWEKKWGFLRNIMQMYHDEIKAEGVELKKEQSHPRLVSEMKAPPSPPVPTTSSGFIGWRSSIAEYSLERIGPLYVSPKLTTELPESYSPTKQINIFIG
ncbi:uncharacterized protein C20orf85 homolog [Zootermopsis nevadensis]|uniref:uncharacterized protein C20orf85 homolog n=1 Tax=Zootermopsis nevadensis TaxID=136037 RepID=UPI000B8E814B|nr:uncharacterized protein C20orf85 homolog [Zootermopsis nevadensis]